MEVTNRECRIKLIAKRKVYFFEWSKRECKFFMAKTEFPDWERHH
jgi:hypothetical protein